MAGDLIEFARARLDDDERFMRTMDEAGSRRAAIKAPGEMGAVIAALLDMAADLKVKAELARWPDDGAMPPSSTVRILAEIKAKRALVDLHEPRIPDVDGSDHCWVCVQDPAAAIDPDPWPCMTLRYLAGAWNGHADYRPEWKI